MLQYLIVLLDDTSVSFCHYDNKDAKRNLIDLEILKKSMIWAMKENLNVQFVYPDYDIPDEYKKVIDDIDNTKIKCTDKDADVVVIDNWETFDIAPRADATYIIKATRNDLATHTAVVRNFISNCSRLNIVVTDVMTFADNEIESYSNVLSNLCDTIFDEYSHGHAVQVNIITDRIMLDNMNNCDAGVRSITLAPNGKFYLCPAFYYDNPEDSVGDYKTGVCIKNPQLLNLEHAPLCRSCDAYHCKRCVWMNSLSTLDINTPSHQQCVISHIERNASKDLLQRFKANGIQLSRAQNIDEIDYLDPFKIYNKWK